MICPGNIGLSAPDNISKPIAGGVMTFKLAGLDKNSQAICLLMGKACLAVKRYMLIFLFLTKLRTLLFNKKYKKLNK
jgi:hypothetical protein